MIFRDISLSLKFNYPLTTGLMSFRLTFKTVFRKVQAKTSYKSFFDSLA